MQQRIERYVVTTRDKGLHIELRQQRNVASFAVMIAAALCGLFIVSPWGVYPLAAITREFTLVTAGLMGLSLVVALAAWFYRMEAVLLRDQVVFKDSFGMKGGVPIRRKLRVRVAILVGRQRSAYPFTVQILDEDGGATRLKFEFSRRDLLMALVEKMRSVVQVEIVDVLRVSGLKVENVGMAALKD